MIQRGFVRFIGWFVSFGLVLACAADAGSGADPESTVAAVAGDPCACQELPFATPSGEMLAGEHDGTACQCGLLWRSDHEALLTCGERSAACEVSGIQWIERGSYGPPRSGSECVLAALRDRAPGVYQHETSDTFTNGGSYGRHRLVVQADGSVLYAWTRSASVDADEHSTNEVVRSRVSRCTLAPTDYFSDCIANLGDEIGAAECLFSLSALDAWFESCEPVTPECP